MSLILKLAISSISSAISVVWATSGSVPHLASTPTKFNMANLVTIDVCSLNGDSLLFLSDVDLQTTTVGDLRDRISLQRSSSTGSLTHATSVDNSSTNLV